MSDPCPHKHVRDGLVTEVLVDGQRSKRQIGICADCGFAVERVKPLPPFGEWRVVVGESEPSEHPKRLTRAQRLQY